MRKLIVSIFDEHTDIYTSMLRSQVTQDFDRLYHNGFDESCTPLPAFLPKPFYKKLVYWFEYNGDYCVFVSRQLNSADLGRVEHCIYTLTGLRGVGNHIDILENLCTPNKPMSTPMKKFLLKRL